jgi:hypothetical protein
MKRFLATCLICLGVFTARAAWADDCPVESKATPASQCVVMRRGEVRGVWLVLPVVTQLRQNSFDLDDEKAKNGKLQEALALRDEQVELQRKAIEEQKAASVKLDTALSAEVAAATQKETERAAAVAKSSSLVRSPWLWASVGATVGGFAGCVAAKGDPKLCGLGSLLGGGALVVTVVVTH